MKSALRNVVRVRWVWALAMTVAVAAIAQAAPAVLDQAPANAQVIIVIPNMKSLSDKIAALQRALQIPAPEMADVLGEFKNQSGMINGVKDDGAAMIVISDLGKMINGEVDKPPMAVAIEVTDYAAFVGNYGGDADAAVAALQMPMGQPGFAKKVGNFAVMGPDEAMVTAYAPAKNASKIAASAGKLGGKYLAAGDAAIYVDIQALAPVVKPKLKEGFDEMMAQMKANMPPDQIAMMTGIFAMYFEAIDTILTDGQGGVYAIDLSDDGIGLTQAFQAKPGSTLARYFPGTGAGGKRESLLNALPNQPYLMAIHLDMKAIDLASIVERALAKMPEDAGWLLDLYKGALPSLKLTNANAAAWYAPPADAGMGGPGLMNMVNVYDTSDGKGYLAATKAYLELLNAAQVPMEELGAQPMKFTTFYREGTMELEGVSVDQYSVKMQMPPELMQQMGPMAMMMGGVGYEGLIAAKGDKVVATTSMDVAAMTRALQAVDKTDGLGKDAAISAARAKALPPSPAMEMHISIEGVLNAVNPMVQMFAGQALPVPPGMPPITMGVGVEDSGVAGRLYLPIKSLQGIMQTAMAAQGAFGGMQDDDDAPLPLF